MMQNIVNKFISRVHIIPYNFKNTRISILQTPANPIYMTKILSEYDQWFLYDFHYFDMGDELLVRYLNPVQGFLLICDTFKHILECSFIDILDLADNEWMKVIRKARYWHLFLDTDEFARKTWHPDRVHNWCFDEEMKMN